MDLLRSLGSAAVASIAARSGYNLPCSLAEKVDYFDGKTIWTLWDGVKRDDSTPVSVFVFEASTPQQKNLLPFAKNALRKLRTLRHPDVLKFVDAVETESSIHIITERVKPLRHAVESWASKNERDRETWLTWGLHRISTALAFINDPCSSTHGNVQIDSIFIAPSGEWRLGGFDLLSSTKDENPVLYNLGSVLPNSGLYAPPEVRALGWTALKTFHPSLADAYALGLLIHCIFNPSHPLPPTVNAPHPPPTAASRGSIPLYLFPPFKGLLHPNPQVRLSPAAFLEMGMATSGDNSGFFANNRLVKVCVGLDNFSLGSDADKAALLSSLKDSASSLPPEFASYRVLPALVSALEFGGASANTILPLVLQLGVNVPPKDYPKVVLAPVIKLFASPDRGTRMALLDHLSEYADKLDKATVSEKIWSNLQTGFTDTVPVIREATVKSIGLLYPKLTDRLLNNELLRHLAKMQTDTEASIRTNTCILIGRLAPSLGYNTKRKMLVPAFTRALRDPFVHARVAGLMAFMATVECFEIEELATKVIPSMSFALVDKEKLVRDQAFKALELLVKNLEKHAATMPETAIVEGEQPPLVSPSALGGQGNLVNSAAGAAGALAGWAMTSLTKKLAADDLKTTITAVDKPTLTAEEASLLILNGQSSKIPLPRDFVISPGPHPALFASASDYAPSTASSNGAGRSQVRGMRLGAHKIPGGIPVASLLDVLGDENDLFAKTWGNDDLMDVNADADDWSAFEEAPAPSPVIAPKSKAVFPVGLGLDGFQTNGTATPLDVEDPWADFGTPAVPVKKRQEEPPRLVSSRLSPMPSTAHKAGIQRSLSPARSTPAASPVISDNGKLENDKTPPISMANMTKEEKAAEMARRREERKQRIAQLKEHKKSATPKT